MNILKRHIDGVYAIASPLVYIDKRGSLARIFDARTFQRLGIDIAWLQQSFSHTISKDVLRGLHVQSSPFTEAKLITVLNGEMYWVVVDVRKDSSTFGKWDAIVLSQTDISGLFVSRGFAHGCLSLTNDCKLVINSDNYYSRDHGIGIAWDDSDLGINWPIGGAIPIISDEHRGYPTFNSFKSQYGGV